MAATMWCDQGHGPHDPNYGCGPCKDEEAAGYGLRMFAYANPLQRVNGYEWVGR